MDELQPILLLAVVALVAVSLTLLLRRATRASGPEPLSGVLAATRRSLGEALRRAWGAGVDASTWETLEEALIAADIGEGISREAVEAVRSAHPESVESARARLASRLRAQLSEGDRGLRLVSSPAVILVVGVNGTGKTTTIAKLASRLGADGHRVVLGAADTFRAAAGEQLQEWGRRLGTRVVSGGEGADPASVAFDAVAAAKAEGADVVIIDTAGRLHAKANLMSELAKVHRVAGGDAGAVDEVLLVLDATGGQNGLAQVSGFAQAVPLSGIVLTKLDGTARGGIAIAVESRLGVPVKLVGVGESLDDLLPFDPDSFVEALLEEA